MTIANSARTSRQADYGIAVGHTAELGLVDALGAVKVLRGITPVLHAVKRGRRIATCAPAILHRPV